MQSLRRQRQSKKIDRRIPQRTIYVPSRTFAARFSIFAPSAMRAFGANIRIHGFYIHRPGTAEGPPRRAACIPKPGERYEFILRCKKI
jgi:hypothetical protein